MTKTAKENAELKTNIAEIQAKYASLQDKYQKLLLDMRKKDIEHLEFQRRVLVKMSEMYDIMGGSSAKKPKTPQRTYVGPDGKEINKGESD